jgi:hypothetical protein
VLLAQRVTYAELVENVGVVHRDVADHEVGLGDQREHVGTDIAGVDQFARRAASQAAPLERRPDQLGMDLLEVDVLARRILLRAEAADDEDARHAHLVSGRSPPAGVVSGS